MYVLMVGPSIPIRNVSKLSRLHVYCLCGIAVWWICLQRAWFNCRGMLKRKRSEVGGKANKLKGGLQKLQETGVQVGEMQVSMP